MSIQAQINRLSSAKSALAASIANKGVAVPANATLDEMPALVDAIEQGGGSGGGVTPATPKDVNFYDYDGTLLYGYTVAEAQDLTELPPLPSHEGLICQGWNYDLATIKSYDRALNIGAMYITDDGKTRLHIRIWDVARSNVPLYISQTVSGGVTIDWGDGSAAQTISGAGNVNTTHQYQATGDYTISLAVADGCQLRLGNGSYCVMGSTGDKGRVYCNLLQGVNIGANVADIRASAFNTCYSLTSITIPDRVTIVDSSAFSTCYSLASITIPSHVTSISSSAFNNCHSLASITIPSSVASIGKNAFYNCGSLASVTMPDSVTSIGNSAFSLCYSIAGLTIPNRVTSISNSAFLVCSGVAEYHIRPTAPPKLASTNAFSSIPSDCIIYVPAASLEAYKTATNWSQYASYMRGE